MVASGIGAAVLAGCAASPPATQTSATATTPTVATPLATSPSAGPSSAISPARGREAADWDVDSDGRRDRARLVSLGGYGPGNWELVVDMTTLGQQAVRFTGGPVLAGNTAAPAIAGSVDAGRDGHAEVFVKVDSGASTQFWTIFKVGGRRIRQVTSQGRPMRLTVNGSVTHQGGFRCDGAQFVTVSEATEPPGYTTWTYERDTFAWSGAELVPVSRRTGRVTSALPGSPPAAYSGVSCGDLPQYAPPYTPPPATSSASPAPSTTRPVPGVVADCIRAPHQLSIRPVDITLACADSGLGVENMAWTSWMASAATGKGTLWEKLCKPNCTVGQIGTYPVAVTLSAVKTSSQGPWFSRMTVTWEATRPPNQTLDSFPTPPPGS